MNRPVFYMPSVFRPSVRQLVPDGVDFLPSALDAPEDAQSPAVSAVRRAMPLSPAEAGAALRELARLGEEYAGDGLLRELAAAASAARPDGLDSGEPAALAAFTQGANPDTASCSVPDWAAQADRQAERAAEVRRALIDCQRVLLLARSQEERLLELQSLSDRLSAAEQALSRSLAGSPDDTEGDTASAHGALVPDGLPWRAVVDAALAFLPENAVLFTSDPAMTRDLLDAGMLRPLPGERAELCRHWPQDLVAGLMYACLPAVRLTGRREPPAARPWLAREVEVLVLRPAHGWVALGEDRA